MVAQPYPFTPSQHAELLHPVKAKGQVFVGRKLPRNGKWDQDSHQPWELDAVLHDLAGEQDVYLTQNRFIGTRRAIAQVKDLTALWADLDFYKVPKLAGRAPEAVFELARELLESAGIPEPSLVLCSGRGLYLVWPHCPVTRKELPTWNACQVRLLKLMTPLGADPKARDAARVLRLVGTRNGKENGGLVYSLRDAGRVRRFDELAEALLPAHDEVQTARKNQRRGADLYDIAVQRAARGYRNAPNGWSDASLWEGRLTDLQTLRRLWYGERRMEDFRDRWLFIAGVAISWLTTPEVLERELIALADEAGGWDEPRTRSKLQAVFERSFMAARGEKVTYNGFDWDPRYHFKNETIIDWLEITPEEEREMVVLIGKDEYLRRKHRRDREYQEKKRRAAGVRSRTQVDQQRASSVRKNAAACRQLIRCGLSNEEAAIQMKVSKRTVERWLARGSSR